MPKQTIARWLLLLAFIMGLVLFMRREDPHADLKTVPYSSLLTSAQEDKVTKASVDSTGRVVATLNEGGEVSSQIPLNDTTLVNTLVANKKIVEMVPPEKRSMWGTVILTLLPVALIIGFFWFIMRKGASMNPTDRAGAFGKHKSQMIQPGQNKYRLSDVVGCEEAKKEVAEVVDFMRNREDYQRVNAKSPRGILMVGPPGTGKTLIAKAIAGEAQVPFLSTSGSEFVEMFVGVGASRVRDMFQKVKAVAPAIIFIDEIDAVGRNRSAGGPGSNDEREQTLNQLLVEMDGFDENSGVVVIAATNRADVLDPALRRPGRFDREVTIGLPDRKGRADILRLHAEKVPVDANVNWDKIAAGTPGFAGADLANLINEAAVLAARGKLNTINMLLLDEARDKILMGVARPGGLLNAKEREIVAYHEAGHAVVARFLPNAEPVHKITIMPRGRALGVTMQLPREDSYNHDAPTLRTEICVLMGGRAAEDVALNTSTVGASNDFHRATEMARRMIGVWGMGKIGPVSFHGERGEDRWSPGGWSDDWKKRVDDEAVDLLNSEYENAVSILREHREALERVAQALLKDETLDADQFEALVVEGDKAQKVDIQLEPVKV
jgi:cell division protease FtsH